MKRFIGWSVLVVGVVAGWMAGCGNSGGTSEQDAGPTCGAGSLPCNGACVSPASDNANCGTCGVQCASGQVCSKGACATSCGGGTTLCGSTCNDLKVDPDNCGACGTKCGEGQVCSGGKCAATCAPSETLCGSSCVNAQTDNANCGACNNLCPAGEACSNGTCGLTCQAGLSLCTGPSADGGAPDAALDSSTDAVADATPDADVDADAGPALTSPYCADFQSDNQNCGGCGIVCGSGQTCKNAQCVNGCASQDGGTLTLCVPDAGAPYCTDTSIDPRNCSACGAACPANDACVGGACTAPADAQHTVLDAVDTGWYNGGSHNPTNKNWAAGGGYHDYFVFDLTNVTGVIQSATLTADNPCNGGATAGTMVLWDVTTPIATLEASNTGAASIETDLASGVSYGSLALTNPATTPLVIPLDSAGRAALMSGEGGPFAIGGDYAQDATSWIMGCTPSANPVTLTIN